MLFQLIKFSIYLHPKYWNYFMEMSYNPFHFTIYRVNLLLPTPTIFKRHNLMTTYHWLSETEQLLSGTPAEPSLPLRESHSMVGHAQYNSPTSYSAALNDVLIHSKAI